MKHSIFSSIAVTIIVAISFTSCKDIIGHHCCAMPSMEAVCFRYLDKNGKDLLSPKNPQTLTASNFRVLDNEGHIAGGYNGFYFDTLTSKDTVLMSAFGYGATQIVYLSDKITDTVLLNRKQYYQDECPFDSTVSLTCNNKTINFKYYQIDSFRRYKVFEIIR